MTNAPTAPMIERILPTSDTHWHELRSKDITSTEVSALFGISPYMTPFELWHRKKAQAVVAIDENERMFWGNRLQSAIIKGVDRKMGWTSRLVKDYIRLPEHRLGCSFDYFSWPRGQFREASALPSVTEVKNVDGLIFRNDWRKVGKDIEAPVHIEIQFQHQLLVSGLLEGHIAALVGGNQLVMIYRKRDPAVIDAIFARAAQFWKDIEAGNIPDPDYFKDGKFIMELFKRAEPKKVIEATEEVETLAGEHRAFLKAEGEGKRQKEARKAEIMTHITDAEKCVGKNFTVHAKTKSDGKRDFRITWEGESATEE